MPKYVINRDSVVRAKLGAFPIRDARQPFRFVVKKEDVEKAVRKDPNNCAIARAVERYTGVKAIAIFRTIAYIPFDKIGDGNLVIERFHMDLQTSLAVRKFDQTGIFAPGEYKFNPPAKCYKLGAFKKYNDKRHSAAPRIKGTKMPSKLPTNPKWLGVRNGTGHVTFTVPKSGKVAPSLS